jgi:hypothetical protein
VHQPAIPVKATERTCHSDLPAKIDKLKSFKGVDSNLRPMPFQRMQISELLWSTQMKDFSAVPGTTDVLVTRIMVTEPYIVCVTADRHFSQESPTTCPVVTPEVQT